MLVRFVALPVLTFGFHLIMPDSFLQVNWSIPGLYFSCLPSGVLRSMRKTLPKIKWWTPYVWWWIIPKGWILPDGLLRVKYSILPSHDDVIKWKHFVRYWPYVRGIHRSPVNSPHKGQWRGALMFSLICTRINGWVNNGEAGDWRRHRAHYDVTVMDAYEHKSVLTH